jgi:uncharacterized membrane protein YeaQ/YmgE (transglycosylase-associated protein family)
MSWIAWIVVGLVAGMLAKWVMPGTKDEPSGFLGTTLLGIVGAVIGGWMCNLFLNQQGANGINLFSVLVAFIGSCILIGVVRMFSRNSVTNY